MEKTYCRRKGYFGKMRRKNCAKLYRAYGNAMIAFHKQDGTFCMEQGTLVGYEKDFHREFKITSRQMSVVYWSMEQHAWRRFMIGNLLEWKAIV